MLVQHFLEKSAERLPGKVALVCDDQRMTYQEINVAADKLAGALIDMGVKRQDRVVIFLDNCVESVISIFGVLKAGAIFIVLNPTMKPKKLNYIINDSGAHALITHTNKARVVEEATTEASGLRHIIWAGKHYQPTKTINSSITSNQWEALFSRSISSCNRPQAQTIDIDLATIIYTSGTKGMPKGVMSTHFNIISAVRSITSYLKNAEDDIILNVLPLSFDYGLYQILMAFYFGGTVVQEKTFLYPYKLIAKLVQEKATGFPLVPTIAAILLQMEDLPKFDFSSLRYITNTAALLPVAHIRKLRKLFSHVDIFSMYGLTECKRVSYLPPDALEEKPTSVGIPMPNEEVFIIDDKGQEVKPNEVGELVVRGANVMQGYWNDPEETDRVFRQGRYKGETMLYTGDLFKRDRDGYLYFVARKDDMIKTKGERVSPKEIENTLFEINGITEVAAIGIPDDILGQAIKVIVVTNENNISEKQIMQYCAKNLEPFMVPKYIEYRDSLPKLNNGKIDKKKLNREENERTIPRS